jgi:hypothetical protein
MNIRRGLIRIWVVLTALLLIPLGIAIHQEWLWANQLQELEIGGHRFKVSKGALTEMAKPLLAKLEADRDEAEPEPSRH